MLSPSTPARHGHLQQRNDSDLFSSPARGVCWSPGASTTLLDGLSRDGNVFRPRTDVESILDPNVSPVRRALQPITSFQIHSHSPFAPPTRSLKRTSSTRSHDSFISGDMARFLASPTNPSSPSALSGNVQSPRVPPSPEPDISFHGAGLDMNELDRCYQLASPASGGSLFSRSASFYTHFSSPLSTSQAFRLLSPVPTPSPANFSSPMFPPPASPPSFATQLSPQTHTPSQSNRPAPPLPPPAFTSPIYPQSPASGPPSMALPPSSPLTNTPPASFEGDPFVADEGLETTRPLARIGGLPVLGDAYFLDYELPSVEPSSMAGLSGPVERRGRVYSTRTRPVKAHASLLSARAGVAKAPRIKSKAPARGRNGEPNYHAAGPPLAGPSTHPGRDSVSTSSSGPYIPYFSPVSSTHTPTPARLLPTGLVSLPDVCAISFTPNPLTPTGFGGSSSSQTISSRFTLPTPAMTASFATPSTATSLATPTPTTLLCPPEIAEPYSTPATFVTRPRDRAKLRRIMRHATPSPISVPEHAKEPGMLEGRHTGKVSAKAAGQIVCVSADEEIQVPGKFESDAEDHWARGEGVTNLVSINASDRPPEPPEPILHFKRSKRGREEIFGDTHVAKRAKEKGGVTTRHKKVKIEPETAPMGFALARPTRSQTRAIAALLAPNTSTERPEEIESNTTSLASSHERTEAAPPAQQVPSARSPRKIGGRPLAPRERVAGRAPSRVVAQAGGQTTTGVIKTSSIKTSEESSGAPSGQAPERHAKAEDGEEPENANMAESDSRNPTRSRSKHMIPSELLPRPDTAVIFGPDGNIKQRTFPKGFPIRAKYERWYRRFPVSAYFLEQDPAKAFVLGDSAPKGVCMQPRVGSSALVPNHAHHFNLYTPRFVRGVGTDKVGLCPICVEPVWRGGEGRAILLNTKISAFNYHMQYYHGICSQTGLPFSPPIAFRHKPHKPAHARERSKIEQGKCHSCKQWIQVESIKHGDILVPELHWWKHAASCHGKSRVEGDQNPYLEDAVYMQLREYESRATPEAGSDQWEHAAVSTDQEQAGAGAALTTISASLDKIGESSNVGSGSSLPSTGKKKLLESAGISGNPFGTMDSDSDLTDLNDDG